MTVSRDLQSIVGRLNDAIVAGRSWTRPELEGLRRELRLIGENAQQEESSGFRTSTVLDELLDGIDSGAAEIGRLVARARGRKQVAQRRRAAR